MNIQISPDNVLPGDPILARLAQRDVLAGLLRDGAFQFARLTGDNLEAYAKTFAALATEALAQKGPL